MPIESKEWSWEFVTADKVVAEGPCEINRLHLVPSGASTGTAVYDGASTEGTKIIGLVAATRTTHHTPFVPPIYCGQGIYIDIGTNVEGVLIQYRRLRGRND